MERRCFKCGLTVELNSSYEGLHEHCFCAWFQVKSPEPFKDLVTRSENRSNDWSAITSSFFHGKVRKYSAQLGGKSYLLKVQQAEVPELPATEYLCNQIARSLSLVVPNHYFIRFQNELDTFVCENFMQDFPGCNLIHIYRCLESPDQFSCSGLLQVLEKEVKKFEDIQSFVKLCLFDSLIGNHDRHGRNLGLIQSGKELRLAPFYDNPSYLAMEDPLLLGAYHEPRGAIATKDTKEPTIRDYVKEWIRLGLGEPVKEFRRLINIYDIENIINNSFVSPKRQQAFLKLIKRRCEEFANATQGL
jgi:hypothetical protein